jgi:hypothetical protein
LALGLLLFLAPWLFTYVRSTSKLEAWASGLAIILIAISAIVAFSEWEEWTTLLLGLWLVVAPWILGFPHTTAMHISIGIGTIVAYLALLDLWLIHNPPEPAPGRPNRS